RKKGENSGGNQWVGTLRYTCRCNFTRIEYSNPSIICFTNVDIVCNSHYIENYMMEAEKAHNRDQEKEILDTVYAFFKKGLEYHDELEQIFIQEMDFTRADEITK